MTLGILLLATYIILVVLNLRRRQLVVAIASFDIITGLIAGVYLIIAAFL